MILYISGRCDIVAFHTKWLMNRYKEGYVDVRNPFYPKLVSRIYFEDVDLILFCTKNPIPILKHLKTFTQPILFHVTITPYQKDIEPNVVDKSLIISSVKELSTIVGIDNLCIRYDPIFLSKKYNLSYHKKAFARLCHLLDGYVKTIIVSFLDEYKNVKKNKNVIQNIEFKKEDYQEIGLSFSQIAKEHGMVVQTCFEDENLVEYGFQKGECISCELAFKLTGKIYSLWKARKEKKCHCVEMVDIGSYNSCFHLCKYCYANYDEKMVSQNIKNHHEFSSLLIGNLEEGDTIKRRKKNSLLIE